MIIYGSTNINKMNNHLSMINSSANVNKTDSHLSVVNYSSNINKRNTHLSMINRSTNVNKINNHLSMALVYNSNYHGFQIIASCLMYATVLAVSNWKYFVQGWSLAACWKTNIPVLLFVLIKTSSCKPMPLRDDCSFCWHYQPWTKYLQLDTASTVAYIKHDAIIWNPW
jgi:hypothetical protein